MYWWILSSSFNAKSLLVWLTLIVWNLEFCLIHLLLLFHVLPPSMSWGLFYSKMGFYSPGPSQFLLLFSCPCLSSLSPSLFCPRVSDLIVCLAVPWGAGPAVGGEQWEHPRRRPAAGLVFLWTDGGETFFHLKTALTLEGIIGRWSFSNPYHRWRALFTTCTSLIAWSHPGRTGSPNASWMTSQPWSAPLRVTSYLVSRRWENDKVPSTISYDCVINITCVFSFTRTWSWWRD